MYSGVIVGENYPLPLWFYWRGKRVVFIFLNTVKTPPILENAKYK